MRLIAVYLALWFSLGLFEVVHADPVYESVFGKWEKISIEDIKKDIPEYLYPQDSKIGSATREYIGKTVASDACPIFDGGKVIGYSMGCLGVWK